MAIFYNKTLRTSNPSDKNAEKKWYPVAKSISPATEKEVAKIIADETTLNPKEAEMAIAQARKAILILLKAGRTVKLGDWATFKVTLRAEGADTEAECTAAKIKEVRPHCVLSKEFRFELQQADFQSTKTMEKKTSKSSGSSTSGGNSGWGDPGDITE
ncbi:MAG: HU family DNA-binding protein [Bacteroidaceae bacterium]|nr:HU family DNA-binding protein [Bacteroidaceae bacterium]